jgi:hypothetical protein
MGELCTVDRSRHFGEHVRLGHDGRRGDNSEADR